MKKHHYNPRAPRSMRTKTSTYKMWPNGPEIVLPAEYHWDAANQRVVANDLSWKGSLIDWWMKCREGKEEAP